MTSNGAFIKALLVRVPELRAIYDEHIADNDVLLPHVFLGDVARFVIASANKAEHQSALIRLLGHLGDGLRNGAEEVKELISVSFAENLLGETETVAAIKPLMGTELRKMVDTVCGS